jgi:hypothetical protein
VAQVVALETKLVAAQDTGRHTIASALPPSFPRPHVAQSRVPQSKGGGLRAWMARLFRRGA